MIKKGVDNVKRKEIIKMFEDIGCKKCTMFKDDPDSVIEGLLDADGIVIDIKVYLKNNCHLTIFCQGILDFTTDSYAGFKDTLIHGYDNIERIEFGQLY